MGFRTSIFMLITVIAARSGRCESDSRMYETTIKPLLQKSCYACHGGLKQEGGLRLDTGDRIRAGGDSGPAILPGKPDQSLLVERVTSTDEDLRMPPEHEGERLSESQLDALRLWIGSGGQSPEHEIEERHPEEHWSFQSVKRPSLPEVANPAWRDNPIDRFIAFQHEQRGLVAQSPASPALALRRLHLDLIGVPPTQKEIQAFQQDATPAHYAEIVDRLLQDPRYGERWGRHWMDIWRYSDWWGLGAQHRNSHPNIWHWRDWIIDSLNQDVPYDEMVRQMLAADELYPDDLGRLRATGYLVRNWFLFNRDQWLEETVEHVSKSLLGLTMNCAKCHDHKYDPIEQADFYRMRAFFEPYHVRVDMTPEEPDLTANGIPRAFDGKLEIPTYLYERGDAKHPINSIEISPTVPRFFSPHDFKILPIDLPPTAYDPGRRSWVLQNHLATAQTQFSKTEETLSNLRKQLAETRILRNELAKSKSSKHREEPKKSPAIVVENFETTDPQRWKLVGGDWGIDGGTLRQKLDGPKRSVARVMLDVPQDFDATVDFEILGGSRWRSVGISFDSVTDDPAAEPREGESEVHVYLSAFEGGPKLQASYHAGKNWVYPTGTGVQPMPVELNRTYKLQVQVRGSTLNANLDGKPILTWKIPIDRRQGSIQLTTFDALANFHGFELRELDANAQLRLPTGEPEGPPRTLAEADVILERRELEVKSAEAELALRRADIHVLNEMLKSVSAQDGESPRTEEIRNDLDIAKRDQQMRQAEYRVAQASLELHQANATEKNAKQKALKTALNQLEDLSNSETATNDSAAKSGSYFPVGAKWTPTRFINSGKDDPTVEFPAESTGRRSKLAEWITESSNPLTSRVAINHLWSRHFGKPLVSTEFDFGRNGASPSHPELLDWLASELMENGWSMKHIHRLICTSKTYRMDSSLAEVAANVTVDRNNVYLWRRESIRLESQVIRDSLLAIAGELDLTLGGPPVQRKDQDTSKRRSVYFFHSNNDRNLFLTQFDEALVKECYRREQSIVPQQALALTNSSLVLTLAPKIAQNFFKHESEEKTFIIAAFQVLLGVTPSEHEIELSQASLRRWESVPGNGSDSARAQFIWTLINHNDFVTLR